MFSSQQYSYILHMSKNDENIVVSYFLVSDFYMKRKCYDTSGEKLNTGLSVKDNTVKTT